MPDWSDDAALWEAMAPALAAPERFAAADADVAAILRAVPLPAGVSVLDVGCGAGAHALAFAVRGFVVTGIDTSEALLRIAGARCPSATFLRADMRDFVAEASFDLVCSLYSSFGYFDEETNARVLANARRSLRPGGTLVLDVLGRTPNWPEHASHEIANVHYEVRRRISDAHLIEEWTVAGKTFHTRQRLFAPPELRAMLLTAGFAEIEFAASLDGATAYEEEGRRVVGFARR